MIKKDNICFCFRCYHTWKKRQSQGSKYCPKCKSPYWSKPRKKISKEFVLKMQETIVNIHKIIIKLSGGEIGIRDEAGIYYSTYSLLNCQNKNKNNPVNIGAFILNDFAKKHYFVDGNKRTAYVLAKLFMLVNKCHLQIEYLNAFDYILDVAKYNSKLTFEDIKNWLEENCKPIEEKEIENYLNQVFVNLILNEQLKTVEKNE